MRKAADGAVQLCYPLHCPVCDEIVKPAGEKICLECLEKLKPLTPPYCLSCGKKMILESEEELCRECRDRKRLFTRGRSVFEYDSAALSIYKLKYAGRQEYADYFGEETARLLGEFLREQSPEALVPMPLHPRREAVRGYNQAKVYAAAISRYTGIPMRADLLKRVRNTVPMKMLDPMQRQNNLKKAFIVPRNDVKLNRVFLVDDIYTTGATVEEAARVLHAAGISEVGFVTIAGGAGV